MSKGPVNILIVEDDEVDLMAIKKSFESEKIANPLFFASDGEDALSKLRGGLIPKPHIVVLDINLPKMNGIDFLKAVRSDPELKKLIVFILTASRDEINRSDAHDLNVAGYFLKNTAGKDFIGAMGYVNHFWKVVELPNRPGAY